MDKSSKKRSVSYMRSYHTNITLIQKRPFPPKNMNLGQVPSELKIEEMEFLICPYLTNIPRNVMPNFLKLRMETRLSGWNATGSRTQSMGLLRMKKIKKNVKFSILVNDDGITSLQVFQKFQFNSKLQIHYGQSFTNSLDVFRDFLENGFNYHLIFIDLTGKTMNGLELMKNIRGIEKLTNSVSSYICGILSNNEEDNFPRDEKGINEVIIRPFDDQVIKGIVNKISKDAIF